MAKLGRITLHVEKETVTDNANLPTHPVESGAKISDHIEKLPKTITLSGKVIRKTIGEAKSVIQSIRELKNTGKLSMYSGRVVAYDMAVVDLEYSADADIANGFNINITLQEVRIANSNYSSASKSAKKETTSGQKQTVNQNTSTNYHIVKKGETYSSIASKYGVTWQSLYEINKTDPKKLQIGQKLIIKKGSPTKGTSTPTKSSSPTKKSTSILPKSYYVLERT